jgi:hypothetical protein
MSARQIVVSVSLAATLAAIACLPAGAVEVGPPLEKLRAVGPEAAGHREATAAWRQLARADAGQLPAILAGLDGAGPLAANWIRTAAETVAERELAAGGKLPAAELERFLLDRGHNPRARRMAFELLAEVDASAPGRLIPGMLDDPSLELRRDAVARLIEKARQAEQAGKAGQSAADYRRAFDAARDVDQVRWLADRLRRLGQQVDMPRHFGLIVDWKLIGPFDNAGGGGFDAVYAPEQGFDPQAVCQGKHGQVKWTDYTSRSDQGVIDLNDALGEEKTVTGYAATEFVADQAREVELRLTSGNAVKLWVNGRLAGEHEVYHSGSDFDQYVARATLRPGSNLILVKVCQNEQTQDWARGWAFQLRVCDQSGTAILSADRDGRSAK